MMRPIWNPFAWLGLVGALALAFVTVVLWFVFVVACIVCVDRRRWSACVFESAPFAIFPILEYASWLFTGKAETF